MDAKVTTPTTVTIKGQVTIPVDIRRRLDLQAGDQVVFEEKDGDIIVRKDDWMARLDRVQERVSLHLKKHDIKPLNDDELTRERRKANEEAATKRHMRSSE